MRGSIHGQVIHLYIKSGINCIGKSKFDAKNSARLELAAEGKGATSAAIAKHTGIHSLGTKANYIGKMEEFGRFAKETFGVKDLEKLDARHVYDFLNDKIELGVSLAHWNGYCAALAKMENALQAYSEKYDRGNDYNFRAAITRLRPEARAELPRFSGTRHYTDPSQLIATLKNEAHQLTACIQYESGLRVAGASNITPDQLRGLGTDPHTGKQVGVIAYIGKGGKPGVAQMTPETYLRLEQRIQSEGSHRVSADGYRNSLQEAARLTGQEYNGSHGLRWCFAQGRFGELQHANHPYEKCLGVVSGELGHNRIEITLHYLFGK